MTPLRMVVMGMIFIASGILWFALDDSAVHENPLMFGDAEFSYAGDLVRVRVPVESELLLMLAHPGGRRAVANQSELSFALERDEVALGHRPLNFQARVDDTVVPVHAKITAWYRLELIDATAHSMEMQLLHDAAHTVRVSPGRLESLTESNHRWVIESNGHEKLTTVPVEIIVEIPGEDPKVFHDDIVRPNLYTPLTLLQPPSRFYPIEDRVQVVGYTMPGAQASAMGEETVADDQGRFSFMISRDKKGQNPILIRVHSEGRLPNERPIEWGSVSSEKRGELLDEQRHDLNQVRDEYDAVSQYQGMEALDPHDPVLIEGRVLSRQRRGNTSAQFIFSMCPGSKGCLVWIDYDGVDLSQNSESVVIAGVYIGQHTYDAEDGRRRTIPRMDARFVVPL